MFTSSFISQCVTHYTILYMKLRLDKWQKGEFLSLLEECEAIQKRLINGTRKPENIAKVFARLMLHGKVAAALRWLGNNRPQLLDTTPDVLEILKNKHPNAAPPCHSHLITDNPLPKVQSVIFENIDAEAKPSCHDNQRFCWTEWS